MTVLTVQDTTKPDGLGLRILKKVTPTRLHRFYTKEAFFAWNVSSWVTMGQIAFFQKIWPLIASKVVAFLTLSKAVAKDAKDAIVEAILIST